MYLQPEQIINLKGSHTPANCSIHLESEFRNPCWISSSCYVDIPVFTPLLLLSVRDRLQGCDCHCSSHHNIKYVLLILFFLKILSSILLSRFLFNTLQMVCRSIHTSCCLCILLHVYATQVQTLFLLCC